MTPKEKADELVTKYRRYLPMNLTTMLDAKNCALIAVDEILKVVQSLNRHHTEHIRDEHIPYWEQVTQEIEKL